MASMIVTCKGRLLHLERSLPTMLKQYCAFPYEVVVVDYGDPDGCFQWAKMVSDPRLCCVRVLDGTDVFNLSRARNCGAACARGAVLAFVDADSCLADTWLAAAARPILQRLCAFTTMRGGGVDYGGLCAVDAETFHQVRGYDESLVGWGFEDSDLYRRLRVRGRMGKIPRELVSPIQHGDDERVQFYPDPDRSHSHRRNQIRARLRRGVVNPRGYGIAEWEMWRCPLAGTGGTQR